MLSYLTRREKVLNYQKYDALYSEIFEGHNSFTNMHRVITAFAKKMIFTRIDKGKHCIFQNLNMEATVIQQKNVSDVSHLLDNI